MDTRVERRRPDRHLIALRLMRRIAIFALVASALLWVVPRVLTELGVMGPRPEQCIETADRALTVARSYGAASLPVFQKAEHERDRARELVTTLATEAQKQALVLRSDAQERAEVVYTDLDKQINDLEKLYSATAPGLEKEEVGQLLSLMKITRQSAGVVFLAYEQKDWNGVLSGEAHAREVIAGTRQALKSAQRP
jgi:hypothetical protein